MSTKKPSAKPAPPAKHPADKLPPSKPQPPAKKVSQMGQQTVPDESYLIL